MSALAPETEACRTTASKVGLLDDCRWWARPEAEWSDSAGPAAERGTRFHAAIAHYVSTGETPEMADDIASMFASAKVWVDHFGRDKLRAEVAFAWDPATDTAEFIGENIGRAYGPWQAKGLLCGSADITSYSEVLKVGYVGDWSTGDGSRKGAQLRALALMLARVKGLDSVTIQSLEVSAEGVRLAVNETLDAFALSAVAGELTEALAAVPTSEPQPGPHCGELYCPARATCPAVRERVADIIPAADLVRHQWGLTIKSPDHAAWLYNTAKAVESAAKAVKEAVRAYVPEEGLALEDGSTLVEGTRNMPRFDKGKAISLARELGATEEQIEACSFVAVESSGLRVQKPAGAAKPRKKRAA